MSTWVATYVHICRQLNKNSVVFSLSLSILVFLLPMSNPRLTKLCPREERQFLQKYKVFFSKVKIKVSYRKTPSWRRLSVLEYKYLERLGKIIPSNCWAEWTMINSDDQSTKAISRSADRKHNETSPPVFSEYQSSRPKLLGWVTFQFNTTN